MRCVSVNTFCYNSEGCPMLRLSPIVILIRDESIEDW